MKSPHAWADSVKAPNPPDRDPVNADKLGTHFAGSIGPHDERVNSAGARDAAQTAPVSIIERNVCPMNLSPRSRSRGFWRR